MKALVLVSGFGGPGLEWRHSPIRTHAEFWGYKPIYFRQDHNGLCDIEHNGRKLTRVLNDLKSYSSTDSVWIVGHSMGGLVAKYASQRTTVKGYVTVGTPHRGVQGAQLARLIQSAQQMAPGSEFLKSLNNGYQHPNALNVVCKRDLVVPYKNQIEHNARSCTLANTGHMRSLASIEVAWEIFKFIRNVEAGS